MHSPNPSVAFSKKAIMNSLLSYMQYRHFEDIKITEIVKKAGVSRKTFYRHFSSKLNVLEELMLELFSLYLEKVERKNSYAEVIQPFFEISKEYSALLELLILHELTDMVVKQIEYFLSLLNEKPAYSKIDRPLLSYCETFSAAGLWEIDRKWLSSGMSESPAEITLIYLQLSGQL